MRVGLLIAPMHHHHSVHDHLFGGHAHTHTHGCAEAAAVGIQPGRAGTQRTVAQVALLGLVSNVLLCLLKAAAGWVLGSAVLLADASHSASDTFGDVLALCCLYKAQKRPTPRYPLGYGKLETLGSVGISIMLLCSSVGIIVHACARLIQTMPDAWRASLGPATSWLGRMLQALGAGHTPSHAHAHAHDTHAASVSAILFVLIGILAKEALYQFTHRMARRTHSSVLEVGTHPLTQASAYHHRMEAIGSLGSFLAIAGSWLGFPMLDPVGGLLLALLYGRGAWSLLLSALQQLCDQRVSEDVYEAIQNAFDEAIVECKAHATPPCEYSALTAIGSGRNVVVHATLHFSPHVRVADALETEKRVHDAVRSAVPTVRGHARYPDADHRAPDPAESCRGSVGRTMAPTWGCPPGSPSSARACNATAAPTRRGAFRPRAWPTAGRCVSCGGSNVPLVGLVVEQDTKCGHPTIEAPVPEALPGGLFPLLTRRGRLCETRDPPFHQRGSLGVSTACARDGDIPDGSL